jgi:hypothetical protein
MVAWISTDLPNLFIPVHLIHSSQRVVFIMNGITDVNGLVPDNNYMVVYIPETKRALVHRVIDRVNTLGTTLDYGQLPLRAGDTMSTYDGGSATIPENGVIPARAYTKNGAGIRFPLQGAWDANDMWYTPDNYRDRMTHVIMDTFPSVLRLDLQIPTGADQGKFQWKNVTTSIDSLFGALPRGRIETAFIPEVVYAFMVGNDTNLNLRTGVRFTYGEYEIEAPKNPYTVLEVLSGMRPASWLTLPITYYSNQIQSGLLEAYGYEGFKVYPRDTKDREETRAKILAEYADDIRRMRI